MYGFEENRFHLKNIFIFTNRDKYIYAKCINKKHKGCRWRLVYSHKMLKSKESKGSIEVWESSPEYYLNVKTAQLYHNHFPFDSVILADKPSTSFNCLWTYLRSQHFSIMRIYKYIHDYDNHIKIPSGVFTRNQLRDTQLHNTSFYKWSKAAKLKNKVEVIFYPNHKDSYP